MKTTGTFPTSLWVDRRWLSPKCAYLWVGFKELCLRALLTLAPSAGRPPELDEEQDHKLWYAWKAHVGEEDDECQALSGDDYLSLYQETGIAMRAIWTLTQRWSLEGIPEEPGSPDNLQTAHEA